MYKKIIYIELILSFFALGLLIAGIVFYNTKNEAENTIPQIEQSEEEKQLEEYNKQMEKEWISFESLFDDKIKVENGVYLFLGEKTIKLENISNVFSYNNSLKIDEAKDVFKKLWNQLSNEPIKLEEDKIERSILFCTEDNQIKEIYVENIISISENGNNSINNNIHYFYLNNSSINNAYRYKLPSNNLGNKIVILKIDNNYFGYKITIY